MREFIMQNSECGIELSNSRQLEYWHLALGPSAARISHGQLVYDLYGAQYFEQQRTSQFLLLPQIRNIPHFFLTGLVEHGDWAHVRYFVVVQVKTFDSRCAVGVKFGLDGVFELR